MKNRIYVCHTFYHVYISFLKELALPKESQSGATIVLSRMSNDFGNLRERLLSLNYFEDVIEFDEKPFTYFRQLDKYKIDRGNSIINLLYRMRFTKKYAQLEEEFVPVNFKEYGEIYVYCDSDPIGYYLNYKHIKYHAMEDGYNSLATTDEARLSNIGNFEIKCKLAEMGLIFMENGHSKYCIDMEVNDRSVIKYDYKKYKSVPRAPLYDRLTNEDKQLLLKAFVDNKEEIEEFIKEAAREHEEFGRKTILILSDPLCDLETRKLIMRDIINEYGKDARVFIKPHPRDELDYKEVFPEIAQAAAHIPMEILNFFEGIHFDTVISVFTELDEIKYADEKIRLSSEFMDKYEAPEIHHHNEKI